MGLGFRADGLGDPKRIVQTRSFLLSLVLLTTSGTAIAAPDAAAPSLGGVVSKCDLETTQRVAFRVNNAPKGALAVGLRLRFYDVRKVWMADEVILASGISAPIFRVARLFDPAKIASVTCSVDGYVGPMDQLGFVSTQPALMTGRKACPQQDGLNVDGGPDAAADTALIGPNWLALQMVLSINHFFPNEESEFRGDPFVAAIDGGIEQKIVVTGQDPQTITWLFTDLRPGFHQVDYGPLATVDAVRHGSPGYSRGYHNFCVLL